MTGLLIYARAGVLVAALCIMANQNLILPEAAFVLQLSKLSFLGMRQSVLYLTSSEQVFTIDVFCTEGGLIDHQKH